jgi:hypothetical protein
LLAGDRGLDLIDQALITLAQNLESLDDRCVGLGIERLEGMVLEFFAQPLHAHAAGKGGIDVHGLFGDDRALGRLDMLDRAHVVQAVGELDQQHSDVARDGKQELAEILRLLGLLGDEVELLDLGQSIDQGADLAPEHGVDFGTRGFGILDGIVQERGCDCRIVEPHFGEDGRHFQRMGEIRCARGPLLVAVRFHGIDIGAIEQRLVGVRLITQHALDQLVLAGHGARLSSAAASTSIGSRTFSSRKSAPRHEPRRQCITAKG